MNFHGPETRSDATCNIAKLVSKIRSIQESGFNKQTPASLNRQEHIPYVFSLQDEIAPLLLYRTAHTGF